MSGMVFENRHVHAFFRLLEEETSGLDFRTPIRIKTAKQFAGRLFVHPNHLNMLLKRHTGLNVSAHIKKRLLEESKALLVGTDWTLETISFTIGFSDQPNFSVFFKKCTGLTPAGYRRSRGVVSDC
jgi:AraC family transcriptional regulator, transcriptional activator of pobA